MAWQLLQPSINLGLEEEKFWDMTLAEINRFIEGAKWRLKTKAQYDYALASMIGVYSARIVSNDIKIPSISEVYPNLFDEEVVEEKPQEDLDTKSINNFLAAAMRINAAQRAKEESGGEHNE